MLIGAGMALTTAPSTGLILSAMPQSRAGVGSAVNDTTREVGGSLGIAILGSIVAAGYTSALDTSRLPGEAAEVARSSIGGALRVAAQSPDAASGAAFAEMARASFTDAFTTAFLVAGAIAMATSAMVWRSLRGVGGVEAGHG